MRKTIAVPWRPECGGSLVLAEAIEQHEEKHGDQPVDERGDDKVHVKPRLRLREENAARQDDQALMHNEEDKGEREPRSGMLGIEPRADGRSEIPDDGFGDTIKSQRNSWSAETVLQKPNKHAQEQSGGRVAPAEAEINRHKQRQIEDGRLRKMDRERRLDDQRQQRRDDDRAGTKLVNFDVRFAADVKRPVHRVTAGGGVAAARAGAFAPAGFSSFFISRG